MESTLKSGGIGADGVAWGLSFPEPFTTSARGSKRKDVFRAEADRRRDLGLTGDSGFGMWPCSGNAWQAQRLSEQPSPARSADSLRLNSTCIQG
jgi:hypothetical protein